LIPIPLNAIAKAMALRAIELTALAAARYPIIGEPPLDHFVTEDLGSQPIGTG
jgi:hypothetical protein